MLFHLANGEGGPWGLLVVHAHSNANFVKRAMEGVAGARVGGSGKRLGGWRGLRTVAVGPAINQGWKGFLPGHVLSAWYTWLHLVDLVEELSELSL